MGLRALPQKGVQESLRSTSVTRLRSRLKLAPAIPELMRLLWCISRSFVRSHAVEPSVEPC